MIRSLVALACVLAAAARAAPPPKGPVERLLGYLRIDTTNPPGNEKAGALYLKSLLDAAGIPSELDEPAPGRANLCARLRGGAAPALLLHHHVDVVPAPREGWMSAPFAAEHVGNRIAARGVLDDKSLGLAELEAFVALKGKPIGRDVVYLATADEEAGGALGVASVAARKPEWLRGVGFAIGEGGEVETVVDVQRFAGIEVAQKSALWIRLTAAGAPGPSSVPDAGNATARLARVLGALAAWKHPITVSPIVANELGTLARLKPKDLSRVLSSLASKDASADREALRGSLTPRYLALVTDTLAITRLGPERGAPNAVPGSAFADLDCRLLPGTDSRAFLAEVRRIAAAERVDAAVALDAPAGGAAPAPGPLYDAIASTLQRRFPGILVAPTLGAGTSENRVLRARGIAAYGLLPFRVSVFDLSGIHGINERIRSDWYLEGVELMKEIVARFAAR